MPGPPPKPPEQRAGHRSKKENEQRVVVMKKWDERRKARQLPDDLLKQGQEWHPATVRWWNTWVRSPLMADLPESDWLELETTAVLHHEFMTKRSFTLAGELRQRMAKFGATPEDRLRLRISIVAADEAERKAGRAAPSSNGKGKVSDKFRSA